MISCLALATLWQTTVVVSTVPELRSAASRAKPGTAILVAPGTYESGVFLENLHGTEGQAIVIRSQNPKSPAVFKGSIQLSSVSYVDLIFLRIEGAKTNGLNIDDGGKVDKPSHHITIRNLQVMDLPKGNHDGIKLSGVQDFRAENCHVERWGGSGVDMVGCHRGIIVNCSFRDGGDSGVQGKGGTSEVVVRQCRFLNYGQRGVNLGGSTGMEFFRPPVASMGAAKYEARNLKVEGCTFIGGVSPVAFVGVDGAEFSFNTIVNPERWAVRILQETRAEGFVPCRNGLVADNLIVYSGLESARLVNIGDATSPQTFKFNRNWWYRSDAPDRSKPNLPVTEAGGTYGVDPKVTVEGMQVVLGAGSPASKVGAGGYQVANGEKD